MPVIDLHEVRTHLSPLRSEVTELADFKADKRQNGRISIQEETRCCQFQAICVPVRKHFLPTARRAETGGSAIIADANKEDVRG